MIKKKIDPSDRREYFYGESVHEYIGVLVEMIMKIDKTLEIKKVDRDWIVTLLTDSISILNDY
jgi:hypothetical protein